MSAALALRGAVFARLAADTQLAALLGAGRIHDGAPRGAGFPHLAVGALESRPLLAAPDEGEEHRLEVTVLSRAASRDEAAAALARAVALLGDRAGLAGELSGHRLIGAHVLESTSERRADGRTWAGRARLRLVTEPLD